MNSPEDNATRARHSGLTLTELQRTLASLPPNPIAPENRRFAQLLPSMWVPRGQMYRLPPQPEMNGHHRPTIVMNYNDVMELIALWRACPFGHVINLHQEIADCAEQLFAEQEATGGHA